MLDSPFQERNHTLTKRNLPANCFKVNMELLEMREAVIPGWLIAACELVWTATMSNRISEIITSQVSPGIILYSPCLDPRDPYPFSLPSPSLLLPLSHQPFERFSAILIFFGDQLLGAFSAFIFIIHYRLWVSLASWIGGVLSSLRLEKTSFQRFINTGASDIFSTFYKHWGFYSTEDLKLLDRVVYTEDNCL
ncbi:hypothetical protein AAC387_Pa05g3188 [Persea americana]